MPPARPTPLVFVVGCVLATALLLLAMVVLDPTPSLAGANGISAAAGLRGGHGLTVCGPEVQRASAAAAWEGLADIEVPDCKRTVAYEPLPLLIVLYAGLAELGLLSLGVLAVLQIVLHTTSAAALGWAVAGRFPRAGVILAAAWVVWPPAVRMIFAIGYDTIAGSLQALVVAALVVYSRTQRWPWLLAAGALCGVGMGFRSYFLLLPLTLVGVFALGRSWRSIAGLLVPVVLVTLLLASVRSSFPGASKITRGAFWHTFWAGVGQFENEVLDGATDKDVRLLAERLAGQELRGLNAQYGETYNAVLGEAGRDWLAANPARVARNTLVRLVWVAVPGTAPVSNPLVRLVMSVVTLAVFLLAVVGARRHWHTDRQIVLILVAPWVAISPLSVFYVIAKVPAVIYFSPLALAALAAEPVPE